MANYSPSGGVPYDTGASRPSMSHRYSSVSDISSTGEYHRDSVVSLPSPSSDGRRFSSGLQDEIDVSRVPLSSNRGVSTMTRNTPGYESSSSLPSLRTGSIDASISNDASSSDNYLGMRSPPTPSRGFNPFNRSPSTSYEPVGNGDTPPRRPSKKALPKRKGSLLGFGHSSIPEQDEIDMGLLSTASPMGFGRGSTAYTSIVENDRDEEPFSPIGGTFDLSGFEGPMLNTPTQRPSVPNPTEAQRLERNGTLTGGLGRGIDDPVTTTISSTDLRANYSPTSPTSPPRLTRAISRALSFRTTGINRAPNLRDMAQSEANRRGEALRVVVEDDDETNVDLSTFEGGTAPAPVADLTEFHPGPISRARTSMIATSKTEMIVHPQDNWKPFSMSWFYLSLLILTSLGLAASTEYLLQKSLKQGFLFKFESAENIPPLDYFQFKYLPTICAVAFGVLWQVTDFEVKRLEAYYQLSKQGGALAAESINVDYITFFSILRPLQALRYKHYAVATSSVATLMAVSLVPTLQSACIKVQPSRKERYERPNDTKLIVIDMVFSRILTSTLVVIAVFGCMLLWQLTRRHSGLIGDVKGIAGIAAMANRSHILNDFKDMDTATPEAIHQRLKKHRYIFRNSSLAPDTSGELTLAEKQRYDDAVDKKQNPHPLMLRLVAGVPFLFYMCVCLVITPVILFERRANIVTEKAPWLITLFAVIVKVLWGTMETDVRMIEPFYLLSKRHASPEVLTLDYTAMAFGWMPIRAFHNKHYLVCAVGVGSILAEVLTVCSSSLAKVDGLIYVDKLGWFGHRKSPNDNLADAGEETLKSFWISLLLAMCILLFLSGVAIAVYARRRHPFLPRQPNTISSILAFIHQSEMLRDFAGTEKLNNDEMVKRLAEVDKSYGLGWFWGRDGELHCGVDEEELHSNYKHGHNNRAATLAGRDVNGWQNF